MQPDLYFLRFEEEGDQGVNLLKQRQQSTKITLLQRSVSQRQIHHEFTGVDRRTICRHQAPQAKREARSGGGDSDEEISERRACRLVGLSRSVSHYDAKLNHENDLLTVRLVELAHGRRRFKTRAAVTMESCVRR